MLIRTLVHRQLCNEVCRVRISPPETDHEDVSPSHGEGRMPSIQFAAANATHQNNVDGLLAMFESLSRVIFSRDVWLKANARDRGSILPKGICLVLKHHRGDALPAGYL